LAEYWNDGTVIPKELEKHFRGNISHGNEYGNSLGTGLLKHISTEMHRLKKHNFWG
jgi:hypothetical protein